MPSTKRPQRDIAREAGQVALGLVAGLAMVLVRVVVVGLVARRRVLKAG